MNLKLSSFWILCYLYFAFSTVILIFGLSSSRYSQRYIDRAWAKMVKRKMFFRPFQKHLGCWPENVIPYVIGPGFSYNQEKHIIRKIYQVQNKTCLRWVWKSQLQGVKKYVEFVHSDENTCHTNETPNGKDGIITRIVLGDFCFPEESIIHEMMHAMGVIHEHQRLDRDCYVKVDETRAQEDTNFKIIYDDTTFERWPYDKRSVTHYTRIFGIITDIFEPPLSFGLWHTLGDKYGWWWFAESRGQMTCMDTMKILYRYCGAPDYCDVDPILCDKIEKEEEKRGCKDIYLGIASGREKPSHT